MEITGRDAQDFLERVTVADVKHLPLGSCTLTIHSLLGVTVTVYIAAILVVHIGNRPACNSQHQWDEKFVNHCSFISQPWGKIGFTIYSTPMEETYYDVIMS